MKKAIKNLKINCPLNLAHESISNNDTKKSKIINEQEASGLLSSLGVKTPLSKTFLLGSYLFLGINRSIQHTK